MRLVEKDSKNYQSCKREISVQEPEEEKQEMNWFLKLIEFYFRIPVIKFVTSMVSLLCNFYNIHFLTHFQTC